MDDPAWIAVDWGTSNVRAWGMGRGNEVLFERSSEKGMARLSPQDYPGVLTELLSAEVPEHGPPLDVLICGMAGARQGWREAPYLEIPVRLEDLHGRGVVPEMPVSRFRPRILPGLCETGPGAEDVMRGEETQLLGLTALMPGFAGVVCMPGTHSKWVEIEGRRVNRFTTAMTGESFELFSKHSVLRHSLGGVQAEAEREDGFAAGLVAGVKSPERLLSLLFKTRAAALLSGRSSGWCAGFLSGLLIGSEVAGHKTLAGETPVPLVGSSKLSLLYARAFKALGVETRMLDATKATLAGLAAAKDGEAP